MSSGTSSPVRLNLASPPRHRLVFRRNKGTRENSSVVIMVSRISPINLIVLKGRENPFLLASCSNCSPPTFFFRLLPTFFQPIPSDLLDVANIELQFYSRRFIEESLLRKLRFLFILGMERMVIILSNFRADILNSGLYLKNGEWKLFEL